MTSFHSDRLTDTQQGGEYTRGRVIEGPKIPPPAILVQAWPMKIPHPLCSNIPIPFGDPHITCGSLVILDP